MVGFQPDVDCWGRLPACLFSMTGNPARRGTVLTKSFSFWPLLSRTPLFVTALKFSQFPLQDLQLRHITPDSSS